MRTLLTDERTGGSVGLMHTEATERSAKTTSRRADRRLRRELRSALPSQSDSSPGSTSSPKADHDLDQVRRTWLPRWCARLATLLGLLCLLDGLLPHHRRLLAALTLPLPDPARAAAGAVSAVSGLLLLRVATGLRRRKRSAWRLALAACAGMLAGDLARIGHRPISVVLAAVLLCGLVLAQDQFTARSDPRGRRFAALLLLEGVGLGLIYGLLVLWTREHVHAGFWAQVREVLQSMVGLGGTLHFGGRHPHAELFHATLLAWGLLVITATVVAFLRSSAPVAALADEDESRLRTVLQRHGARDSLGYFALRRDKAVVWSPSGKAAVTYRVVAGVALISGDPLGDPEAWPGAIAEYRRLVETYGWTAAAMGCSEQGASILARELGLSVLALGDEAVLDTAGFSLDGRHMRGVRQACTRAARAGYEVTLRRMRDVPAKEIEQLRRAADAWRTDPVERGFSMALSRLGDPADGDCVVVTARRDGELRGLLHFVPWGTDGISLDLMRRDRNADNGLNEYMIAELVKGSADLGIKQVSLNFAMFRDALDRGAQLGAGPVVKFWRWLLVFCSRWWQIDTLYRFNDKFHPRWEPRFVCYPGARDIPRVTLAALEAEAFVVRPRLLDKLVGRG